MPIGPSPWVLSPACPTSIRSVVMQTDARRAQSMTLVRRDEAAKPAPDEAEETVAPAMPKSFSGLNKTQAEELLDWLQAHGYVKCEVSYEEKSGFTVHVR